MKIIFAALCVLSFSAAHSHTTPAYGKKPNKCVPVTGNWGEWSSYSPCTTTCGQGGVQKRYRFCDSPVPRYGGKDCVGDSTEVKPCEGYYECPVDGGWGVWKKEGECSKSCGGGVIVYKRHCDNPPRKHCGKDCHGPKIREEPCSRHYCPIDGEWNPWVCGKCVQTKGHKKCVKKCKRTCTPPKYGGKDCEGKSITLKHCHSSKCVIPHPHPCHSCLKKAEKYAYNYERPEFVGHACRVDSSYCKGLNGGIKDMYIANNWFFLHCSPDGPWCKPCATRNLVYNPTCGQCEESRYGKCTGPMEWRNKKDKHDDEIEVEEAMKQLDDIEDIESMEDDLW